MSDPLVVDAPGDVVPMPRFADIQRHFGATSFDAVVRDENPSEEARWRGEVAGEEPHRASQDALVWSRTYDVGGDRNASEKIARRKRMSELVGRELHSDVR